ncbi:UNVERIFIED_CONTAM: hypothetical protein PYX00_000309 [Menopon gallinae]|uniref:O-acyltransferase WSD1 C-terminal domain-containing protein n=2 Tax=Menopon gallinae TaxID=328185 RepID=A0AAW2I8K2_9NEOP
MATFCISAAINYQQIRGYKGPNGHRAQPNTICYSVIHHPNYQQLKHFFFRQGKAVIEMMVSEEKFTLHTMGYLKNLYTFLAFLLMSFTVVIMFISYYVIQFVRNYWISFLENKFPDLEFVRNISVRSAVDTHRNMGIITLLVTVKGQCDPDMIKKRLLEDILEKRQNDGRYTYRHLRMSLTSKWGCYAWQNLLPFNIDNHLILSSSTYRGRPVTESNIQEYISEIVSKYLVPDLPPWQINVVSSSSMEKYYLLVRIHHMLLSHADLDLQDLLLLSQNKNEHSVGKLSSSADPFLCNNRRSHPFEELYKTPKSIPILYDQLCEAFSNNWNEFVSVYDPLENPSILKKSTLKTIFAITIIALLSGIKKIVQQGKINNSVFKKEFKSRQLTMSLAVWSMWNTFNPFSVTANVLRTLVDTVILLTIKLPLTVAAEIRSLCMIYDQEYSDPSYVKSVLNYWPFLKDAFKEALYCWKLAYNGPRIILEEFLSADNISRHHLQLISLCGRKVVSWSDPVPLDEIYKIQDVTGASTSEIFITAASASLRDLLIQYSLNIPDTVLTTARYFSQDELMKTTHRKRETTTGGGILCLALPIRNPFGLEYDPVTELRAVQQVILRARLRQPVLYLTSLWLLEYGLLTQILPSPVVRLLLNILSRRFPVTLSQVAPADANESYVKRYLWGQEIEDVMYWRPPQANICISLTFMVYGDYVRLGVMSDAMLSPNQSLITSTFAHHIRDLASAAGVTSFGNFSFPSDDSDRPETSHSSHNTTTSSSSLDLDFEGRNYSDDDNNVNLDESFRKYPSSKNLQFNIPSR